MSSSSEDSGSEAEFSTASSSENQPESSKSASHKRNETESSSFIPSGILSSAKLVSLATRVKVTPDQQRATTKPFVKETGDGSSKVKLCYAHACRKSRQVAKPRQILAKTNEFLFSFLHCIETLK